MERNVILELKMERELYRHIGNEIDDILKAVDDIEGYFIPRSEKIEYLFYFYVLLRRSRDYIEGLLDVGIEDSVLREDTLDNIAIRIEADFIEYLRNSSIFPDTEREEK